MRRLAAAALIMVSAAPATAQSPAPPGVTLPRGGLAATVTAEASVSAGAAFEPASLAPDLAYGVTGELTLALVHSGFATTGFRGNAGRGVCMSGTDGGCAKVYNRVGVEALYGVRRGPLAAAANAGIHMVSLDPAWAAIKVGARTRYLAGNLVATCNPSVFIGVNHRAEGNKGSLWLPLAIGYKVAPPLLVSVGGGPKVPDLGAAGDTWVVAVGVIGQYTLSPALAAGASFFFGELAGASAYPDAAVGPERRYVQAWISYNR